MAETIDLSAFISSTTEIRFVISGDTKSRMNIDNVSIVVADVPAPTTTTTTTPAVPTTTTTVVPATTTTTTTLAVPTPCGSSHCVCDPRDRGGLAERQGIGALVPIDGRADWTPPPVAELMPGTSRSV